MELPSSLTLIKILQLGYIPVVNSFFVLTTVSLTLGGALGISLRFSYIIICMKPYKISCTVLKDT